MDNQKRIKSIVNNIKAGNYDDVLCYIRKTTSLEELLLLREHKILQYIVDKAKNEKVLNEYLEHIKKIDNDCYLREKNS